MAAGVRGRSFNLKVWALICDCFCTVITFYVRSAGNVFKDFLEISPCFSVQVSQINTIVFLMYGLHDQWIASVDTQVL